MPELTAREKEWRAEGDAHTLMTAELLKNDPQRLKKAIAAAKKLAKREAEETSAMKKVANRALSKVQKAKPKAK